MISGAAHQSVLLPEAVDALHMRPDGFYVDGTFGRGGHAGLMLGRLNEQGRLMVMDRDPDAIAAAMKLMGDDQRVTIVHAPFSSLGEKLKDLGYMGKVDGILFDFGVSSPQLDTAERGFSFQRDGALDMRMDTTRGQTAAQWLAAVGYSDLVRVLRVYGEERFAKRIANAVIEAREETPIETTAQLSSLISDAIPVHEREKHPATRSFQAIRIAINEELQEISTMLPDALDALAVGGRLVVISFHSLEDRPVKRLLQKEAKGDDFPPDLPIRADQIKPRIRLVGKPVRAGAGELETNRRARSAIMRVAEKVRA
ncbi:MAG: 16S rRNA (cytosine(1402)-N(4))-methyltransferase RsmH [Proteobacteria bacterium]|nr:16S rRNA (cytosine(1402)-N(4))-methyltransferase RsmH [Pseudomonadota bacterium]